MDEKKKEKEKKSKTSPFFSRQEEACRVKKVLINLYAVLRETSMYRPYILARLYVRVYFSRVIIFSGPWIVRRFVEIEDKYIKR